MQDRDRRCFRFEAPFETRVVGYASVANGRGTAELNVNVKDKRGRTVYQTRRGNPDHASFSFQTPKYDEALMGGNSEDNEDIYNYDAHELEGWYDVCLEMAVERDSKNQRAVTFWIRAEDYYADLDGPASQQASDEQVNSVSRSLRDMHEKMKGMIRDMVLLQQRERRLVDHGHATAKRLVILAVVSVIVIIVTAVLQYMHFKNYFKSKKLL